TPSGWRPSRPRPKSRFATAELPKRGSSSRLLALARRTRLRQRAGREERERREPRERDQGHFQREQPGLGIEPHDRVELLRCRVPPLERLAQPVVADERDGV